MNCCISGAVKYRNVQSGRLCRSPLREWEGFKDSGKVGEALFCSLSFNSSFCLDMDTHMHTWTPHTRQPPSSISARASVVTFWLEVCRSVGQRKGLLQQLCASRRGSVWRKQLRLPQYGQETPSNHAHGWWCRTAAWRSSPSSYFYLLIFISCDSLFVSTFFASLTFHSLLSASSSVSKTPRHSLILSFCVSLSQEKSSTTWLHMEEWRKKRPGLNLDRYPAFSPCSVLVSHLCSRLCLRQVAVLCPASGTPKTD